MSLRRSLAVLALAGITLAFPALGRSRPGDATMPPGVVASTDAGVVASTDAGAAASTDAGAVASRDAGAAASTDAGAAVSTDAGVGAPPAAGTVLDDSPDVAALTPSESNEPSDAGRVLDTSLEIADFTPFESLPTEADPLPASSENLAARAYGRLRLDVGVDTGFEAAPRGLEENVGELLGRGVLGVDLRLSERLRALVEARVRWQATTQAGWERRKASAELEVGEAFLDLYSRAVDLRIGHQIVAFGANVAFSPTDILNPRDLRDGLLLGDPETAKLPVSAVRALTQLGRVNLSGVIVPFFVPHRYALFGQDEALLQPALGVSFPRERIDPSIEDAIQPRLLEASRPQALPWLGDYGARATLDATPDVKLGLSFVSVNEKLPQVDVDPELRALLEAESRGQPVDNALALSVQNRFRAGETLFDSRYARQHVFGLEASALVATAQVDLDLGYSPAQTFYDARLRYSRKPVYTLVLGATQASDSPLRYAVSYLGMVIPEVAADELLLLLEPATARGGARTAVFHLVVADVVYSLLDDRLVLGLRAAFDPIQRSFALAPNVAWKLQDRVSVGLGAELFEGRDFSPFGYFGRNDQLLATLRLDL